MWSRFISKAFALSAAFFGGSLLLAQEKPLDLPSLSVFSPRVANQEPAGTFAMPVSALRFEPLVDLQARNMAEGQADITVRGGIFENTGFRVGATPLFDPQTGHYLAEIPVAPGMLTMPVVRTGVDNALEGFNANVGTISYDWRRITPRGELSLTAGENRLDRESFYQGYVSEGRLADRTLAADAEFSHSRSQGSRPNGDHHFSRVDLRLQLANETSQTDLFYGYQAKIFGWPNLYTPFNSPESENLQTNLLLLNHRVQLNADGFVQIGAFYRRNKDDYAFNRFTTLGPIHPFQHTTWERGASLLGRTDAGPLSIDFSGEILSDDLRSTSLTFGNFKARTYTKLAAVPKKIWTLDNARRLTVRAGITFDDTNRDSSALSPVAEIALEKTETGNRSSRVYTSYSKTTQVATYTALKSSTASGLFRGNPHLGRELAQTLEFGWGQNQETWSTRAALFYRRDDGLVDWTFRRGVTARTANAVDLDTVGAEAVVNYHSQHLDLVLGYTFLNKAADYRGAAVDASFYALNFAKHRFTIATTARLGQGWEVRLDNEARVQADNLLRAIGGDETLLSTVGVFYRPPSLRALEFSLTIDNLWNSNFQDVPAVPAPRRQVAGGLTYRW